MRPKNEFPFFASNPNLVYLDTAATGQMPATAIDVLTNYYRNTKSNIDGWYSTSLASVSLINEARGLLANWAGVEASQVVFGTSATQIANLIAATARRLKTIIVAEQDHHSTQLPFIERAKRDGCRLVVIPVLSDGSLDVEFIRSQVDATWSLVSLTWVSNSIGILNPIEEITQIIREKSPHCLIVLDASQGLTHADHSGLLHSVDAWYTSGHKIYGPFSTALLVARDVFFDKIKPLNYGGKMVELSSTGELVTKSGSEKYEAGTPDTAGLYSLSEAVKYISQTTVDTRHLVQTLEHKLLEIHGIRVLAADKYKPSLLSFYHEEYNSSDIGMILARHGIAIRSGNLCAALLQKKLGVAGLVRVSFGIYSDMSDVEAFINKLAVTLQLLQR